MNNKLTIAIQKDGKLTQDSLKLLIDGGFDISYSSKSLKASVANFPLDLIFVRDDDIPELVAQGVVDIGIVGQNEIQEKQSKIKTLLNLGYSKCRLSIAVPKTSNINNQTDLQGLKIATSYPNILNNFLTDNQISAKIVNISGSVEISPFIDLADCICDLVSTGATLEKHGLREIIAIFNSEASLISYPNTSKDKELIINDILFRIQSVLRAKNQKYILVNVPNESIDKIQTLIPGMEKPTVSPLSQKGWSAIQSVINTKDFWDIAKQLENFGGKDILLMPIENIIL